MIEEFVCIIQLGFRHRVKAIPRGFGIRTPPAALKQIPLMRAAVVFQICAVRLPRFQEGNETLTAVINGMAVEIAQKVDGLVVIMVIA